MSAPRGTPTDTDDTVDKDDTVDNMSLYPNSTSGCGCEQGPASTRHHLCAPPVHKCPAGDMLGVAGGTWMLAAVVLTTFALGFKRTPVCSHMRIRTLPQRSGGCKPRCEPTHSSCGRKGAQDTAQHLTRTHESAASAPPSSVSAHSADSGMCSPACERRASEPRLPLLETATVSTPAACKRKPARPRSRDFDIAFVSEASVGTSVLVDALRAVAPGVDVPTGGVADGEAATGRPFYTFSIGRGSSRRCNLWDVKANDCVLPDGFGTCAGTCAATLCPPSRLPDVVVRTCCCRSFSRCTPLERLQHGSVRSEEPDAVVAGGSAASPAHPHGPGVRSGTTSPRSLGRSTPAAHTPPSPGHHHQVHPWNEDDISCRLRDPRTDVRDVVDGVRDDLRRTCADVAREAGGRAPRHVYLTARRRTNGQPTDSERQHAIHKHVMRDLKDLRTYIKRVLSVFRDTSVARRPDRASTAAAPATPTGTPATSTRGRHRALSSVETGTRGASTAPGSGLGCGAACGIASSVSLSASVGTSTRAPHTQHGRNLSAAGRLKPHAQCANASAGDDNLFRSVGGGGGAETATAGAGGYQQRRARCACGGRAQSSQRLQLRVDGIVPPSAVGISVSTCALREEHALRAGVGGAGSASAS